jgi:molecular chaperone HtpG
MKEMSQSGGGGMFGMDAWDVQPSGKYQPPLATTILGTDDKAAQEHLVKQALDLAKLSQNLLKGEALTAL